MVKGIYKKCIICKKSFYVYPYEKEKRKVCSIECKNKLSGHPSWNKGFTKETDERIRIMAFKNSEIKKGKIKKRREYKTCPVCNKEFTDFPYIMKIKKYCSKNCANKVITENRRNACRLTGKKAKGRKISEEHKKILSIKRKQDWLNPNYKIKMKQSLKKHYEWMRHNWKGEGHPLYGTHPSFVTINKQLKTKEERNKIYRRERHWNWLGGKSFEPYDRKWNELFRRQIRKRDNYICMKCGIHQEKENKSLDVHHINYDKKLSIPQNCVTLCHRCNIEVNQNRTHWIKFFQSLLFEIYRYEYENQEIVINLNQGEANGGNNFSSQSST